jgi:hypothetical protein
MQGEANWTAGTDELVAQAMEVSKELRFRWHKGLHALCMYIEKTFLKLNQVVAWNDDKLYIRINKIMSRMVIEVLYTAIEDMETRYPMSLYAYVYDVESDELVSFNTLQDGTEKPVLILIEFATPMEDRPIFQKLKDGLNVPCDEFMTKLESVYANTLPNKGKWPFESREDVPVLKAWPSRQEGPPNLELILEKAQEAPKK